MFGHDGSKVEAVDAMGVSGTQGSSMALSLFASW